MEISILLIMNYMLNANWEEAQLTKELKTGK